MNIIEPYIYLDEHELSSEKINRIEHAARLCYKSENKMGENYSEPFIKGLISRGHLSVIEHEKVTVYFVVDRGISHEIVRHRIGSYSQESTRYCNYLKEQFGNEITVIRPFFWNSDKTSFSIWKNSCENAEKSYMELLKTSTPQEARSVLPNSLKTEIAVTYNLREWRHFFSLRCAKQAHPQMQQVAIPLLLKFKEKLDVIFDDIKYNKDFPADCYANIEVIKH